MIPKHRQVDYRSAKLLGLTLLILTISLLLGTGCAGTGGADASKQGGVASTSVANLAPSDNRTTNLPAATAILQATPSAASTSPVAPSEALTTYTDKKYKWQIQYPANLLIVQQFSDNIVIFATHNRSTFVAIDAYFEKAERYGNSGENLRNRARQTLDSLYGVPVDFAGIPEKLPKPWLTGMDFTTNKGMKGEAVYTQPASVQPSFTVYGFIYGYNATEEARALKALQTIRDSFTEIP